MYKNIYHYISFCLKTKYFLILTSFFYFAKIQAQAPVNDNPCNAIEVFVTQTCNNPTSYSNINATTTTNNGYTFSGCSQTNTAKDVWFKIKTSNNNSNNDTQFAITTNGAPVGQIRIFSAITCAGPFSEIAQACEPLQNITRCTVNNAQPNTTYYIMVGGYWNNSPTGNFTLCATPLPVSGCTNNLANNYNLNATYDNGSCIFPTSPITTCGIFSSSPNALISNVLVTTDVINISIGPNKVLTDLDVILKLNHSFLSDIDVFLTSPSGTTVELLKNICGSSDNMEVRFDDDSYPLQCGNPTKGFYRLPVNYLSAFNNEPSDGNWTLKVIDMSPGNNGLLTQWCLVPQVKTVTCFPPIMLKANNITSTTANLDWTSPNVPQENNWNIELGLKGFSPTGIPTKTATVKPFIYNGLQPYKTYDYYVQAKCLPGLGSSWSGPFTFTTAIPNGQCNLGINIPNNQCNQSNNFLIYVQNAGGNKLGTNVQLEEVRVILRHTWDSDLSFYLTSPNGKFVELSSKNGGPDDNYGDPNAPNCSKYTAFVRNDCAASSIIGAQAPFIGKFYPEGNLSDFLDGSDPNGNWNFRICDDADGDVGRIEYIELVFSSNTCAQPRNVSTFNITDKTLEINYLSENTSCNKVIVEYGMPGFTPGTGVLAGVGGTVKIFNCSISFPLQIAGLSPLHSYDIYVREQCNATQFSPNSCAVSFETNCTTGAATLSETFDNQVLCNTVCGDTCAISGTWHNTKNDDFDWIINLGSTPSTNTGPEDDITGGGKYAYLEAGNDATCQNGKIAYLMSDCIKVNANADTCAMSFYYHAFGNDINKVSLQISTDGGANWLEIWSISSNQGNRWFHQYIDLQLFKNKIVQFRFVGFGGTGIKADLAIDQIDFYGSTNVGTAAMSYYKDADGDSFGDALSGIEGCATSPPNGFVFNNLDCDDTNANIKPTATEIPCNKIDENCNGIADDAILPLPWVKNDTLCAGEKAILKTKTAAKGQFFWYDSAITTQTIATGDSLVTNVLTATKNYYVKDSLIVKPELRFTEINLGLLDAVELQNIGNAKDFTGWSVVLGNTNLQAIPTAWNLGAFAANEVQYRTKSASNNFFGTTWNWNYTAKGFALLLDNQGIAKDFILFNTTTSEFDNLSFLFNGKTYNKQNLPWKNAGVNGLCSGTKTINLIANGERNDATDYDACSNNTMGNPNLSFNLDYPCNSQRVLVQAIVQQFPQLIIPNLPEICEGKSIDVRNIIVTDLNNTQGQITYHSTSPTSQTNQLTNNILTPNTNTNIVIKKTTSAGCFTEKTTTIKVNDLPLANIVSSTTMPLCSGQTKTLIATYSGGVSPVNYEWSTGAISQNIQVGNSFPSTTGFYGVTLTDAKGCVDSASTDVFNGAGITSAKVFVIKDVSSCNGTDGAITLKPIDGTPPYKYTWNGPIVGNIGNVAAGNYTIQNLQKGTYSVTITDSSPLNCELIIPFLVVKSPDVNIKIDSVWSVSCKGKNDGKILLENVNSQAYSYIWSNSKSSKDITNLATGSYAVTISSSACNQVLQNIVVKEPDSLGILSAIAADISCTANGKINLTPKGGNPPYSYLWSNNASTQDLANISPGNYFVTISDKRNCKFISPKIELKSVPNLALSAITSSAKCNASPTGKIDLNVTGGGRPYAYKWSNSAVSEDLTNVVGGTYTVSVTDANGCQVVSAPIVVSQPAILSVASQIAAPTCKGFADGAIQLVASGGTANYTYLWDNGTTKSNLNQLVEGAYKVTITDANACKVFLDSIKITAPQVLNVSVLSLVNATCVGKTNGKIDINVSGGTLPYTYLWNNAATTQDLLAITTGVYSVSISDNKGCKAFLKDLNIGGTQTVKLNKDSLVMPTCNGSADGKIFFAIKGGQVPYNYKWSNNTFNASVFNLKSNIYTVTATDFNGCQFSKTYQLNEPNPISISLNAIDSVGCYGAEDAAIDVAVSGGTMPYKFFWNSGQNTEDLSGVVAGDYKMTVLDKNNCAFTSEAFIVLQSQPLLVQLQTTNDSKCKGSSFGTLDVKVTGGKAPYLYQWSNGATSEDIFNVPSGTYSVTVSDANDCKAILNNIVILSPLQQLRLDTVKYKEITCNNSKNGEIIATILGGKTPFAYNWSVIGEEHLTTQRADTIRKLGEGAYILVVTDGLGCTLTSDTINLTNPKPLNIFITDLGNPTCKGRANGFIKANNDGGTLPYKYLWNNGKTTKDLVNIPQGSYQFTLTDANNCTKISPNVSIQEPINSVTISVDSIHNVSCKYGADGDIFLNTLYGEAPFSYQWSKPATTTKGKLNNLLSGVYSVTVTDSLGCKSNLNFIPVPEPQALGVLVDTVRQNACKSYNSGSIEVSGLGGVPPYSWKWSNGKSTEDIFNLPNGLYKVTLTDINKCIFLPTTDISIGSPDSLKVTVTTSLATMGQNNATASANVSGGKSPFSYKWSDANAQTTQTAINLAPGSYDVTVTDANKCVTIKKGNQIVSTTPEDLDLQAVVKIYPNPTTGFLNVEYNFSSWVENTELIVFDLLGKNILQRELFSASEKIELDLNELSCGVYWIGFRNEGRVFGVKKVVVCR